MSTITADTIVARDGGPAALTGQVAAKAWGSADLTSTPAFDDSLGMTSITDNATGDMTFNFSVTMANANYCVVYGGTGTALNFGFVSGQHDTITKSTTTHRMYLSHNNGTLLDGNSMNALIVGDLA